MARYRVETESIGGPRRGRGGDGRKAVAWTKEWGNLKKRSEEAARGAHVRVGVLSNGSHRSVRKSKHVGERGAARNAVNKAFNVTDIGLVELAAIHEFGSPAAGIPERSFIRRTLDLRHAEIASLAGKLAERVVHNKLTLERALDMLGHFLAAEIKKTISNKEVQPQLDPAGPTAQRKGSTTALIDSSQLKNSVSHQVRMTGDGTQVTS